MCKYFSCVMTEDEILIAKDPKNARGDSHENIIDDHDLSDSSESPDFVRIEMVPKYSVKTLPEFLDFENNWDFNVDQDLLPSWWDKKANADHRDRLIGWMTENFKQDDDAKIVGPNGRIHAIYGRVYEVDQDVKYLLSGGHLTCLGGNTVIGKCFGKISYMNGNSRILNADGCTFQAISDQASIGRMDHSTVIETYDYARLDSVSNSALNYVGGCTRIKHICDSEISELCVDALVAFAENVDFTGISDNAVVSIAKRGKVRSLRGHGIIVLAIQNTSEFLRDKDHIKSIHWMRDSLGFSGDRMPAKEFFDVLVERDRANKAKEQLNNSESQATV